ncbi:MAG TPA: hypothetical protein VGI61_03285 [Parafilimonas sp.]
MEVHHHPHVEKKNFKEYFREFIMIFLAVTLGFFAESLREFIVEHGKEKHYVRSLIADLKKDTAAISLAYPAQKLFIKNMSNVLKIPIDKISDIPTQDTFYRNFVNLYASYWVFVPYSSTITQLNNGGFSVFHDQDVIDSINALNSYYESLVKLNADAYLKSNEKTADLATQLIRLPVIPASDVDSTFGHIPDNTEVFIQYNKPLLEQLYSNIRYQKGALLYYMGVEKEYAKQITQLIKFLQKKYHMH